MECPTEKASTLLVGMQTEGKQRTEFTRSGMEVLSGNVQYFHVVDITLRRRRRLAEEIFLTYNKEEKRL